jgi:phosphatidylserine/phosphatidylglycerophosphate/cardiolipin synthase-like enzyme
MASASTDFLLPGLDPTPGNLATPLIDGRAFLDSLDSDLSSLVSKKGDFVFIQGWHIGMVGGQFIPSPFMPPTSGVSIKDPIEVLPLKIQGELKNLAEFLREKTAAEVDVRVLGWVNPFGMANSFAEWSWWSGWSGINALTIRSILNLREEPKLEANAALNVVSHAGGAVHARIIVIGNSVRAVGYTGGWDLIRTHVATPQHVDASELWHDTMLRIEGPGVQSLYDAFRVMWNANLQRPRYRVLYAGQKYDNVLKGATAIDERTLPTKTLGTVTTQSVRTIPAEKYASFTCKTYPAASPLTTTGSTQLRDAWSYAISQADKYIYMEDQYFWSKEVMSWIHDRMAVAANLRVILVAPGQVDPDDPNFAQNKYRSESINHTLLENNPEFASRVRFYRRWGPVKIISADIAPDPPVSNKARVIVTTTDKFKGDANYYVEKAPAAIRVNDVLFKVVANEAGDGTSKGMVVTVQIPPGQQLNPGVAQWVVRLGITVHAKTTLIDDRWAMIGSPNVCRRSLYTDWEHAVGFIDQAPTEVAVKQYRKALWADHFARSNPDDLEDLDGALNSWFGVPGGTPPLPTTPPNEPGSAYLQMVPVPFVPDNRIDLDNQQAYDVLDDIDSRETWGGIFDILRARIGAPR